MAEMPSVEDRSSEESPADEVTYEASYAQSDDPEDYVPAYLEYTCKFRETYALAITSGDASSSSIAPYPEDLRICTGSYNDHGPNKIKILGIQPELIADPKPYALEHYMDESQGRDCNFDQMARASPQQDFECLASRRVRFPPTKVAFGPPTSQLRGTFEFDPDLVTHFIATSSDALRIYDYHDKPILQDCQYVGRSKLSHKGILSTVGQYAKSLGGNGDIVPMTSFDWCTIEHSHIVTSNVHGECAVWDLKEQCQRAITKILLEAPVYDVTWEPGCRHTFVAATQDEAIHYVDTRAVGQLRTLYVSATGSSGAVGYRESEPASHAMARVAFDPRNPYLLAALQLNDNIVRLLDTRRPGHLVAELDAHDESVNGIAWRGSTSSEQTTGSRGPSLATVSDDCRVLLWDTDAISSPADMDGKWKSKGRLWRGAPTHESILPEAAENVAWGVDNDFLAVTMGSRIRCMRI